jgi:hypothetical protein
MQRLMHHFKSAFTLTILISSMSSQSMELVSGFSQSFISSFSPQKLYEKLPILELQIVSTPVIGKAYIFGKTVYGLSGLAYYCGMHSVQKWAQENHVDEKEEILQAVLQEELQKQAITEKWLQVDTSDSKYKDDVGKLLAYLGHKNPLIVQIKKMEKDYKNYDTAAGYCNGKLICIKDNDNYNTALFTCAHETAHYALRHVYHTRDSKEYEKEADLVAAYTLCGLGLESAVEDRISLIDSLSDAYKDEDDGTHPTRREESKYLTEFLNADDNKRISIIYNNMSKEQKRTGQLKLASEDQITFYTLYLMDKYIVQSWQPVIQQIRKSYYEKTRI